MAWPTSSLLAKAGLTSHIGGMPRRKKRLGLCSICGVFGELSYEHVPPEAAFNDRRVFEADIHKLIKATTIEEFEKPAGRINQRGAGRHTLCERCNSSTGSWYGADYVDWAAQGMDYLGRAPSGSTLLLPFQTHPLRVLKQVFAMFASACGPDFFRKNPSYIRYLLNKEASGFPPELRVYCFYLSPESTASRQAGISGMINLETQLSNAFAEIAFPPFGYVLSLDGKPVRPDHVDITWFGGHAYADKREVFLKLPVLPVTTYFPGDYRSKDEFRAALGGF